MGQLDGKVAVVTGGASGIGAATVRRFVAEGARVMIADLQDDVAADLAAGLGDAADHRRCNVADEDDVAGVITDAASQWGRLDVLFNNAGIGGAMGPFKDTSVEDYQHTMDVLVKSAFLGVKHASPIMIAQESGSIISTASVCGLVAGVGPHVYSMAKAAVIMLTKTAALELAEHNVRVNCICPGYIATPGVVGAVLSRSDPAKTAERLGKVRERNALAQPIPRMGEPDDIASAALFLASDASAWMTGTAQVVDGGLTIGPRAWRDVDPWISTPRELRRRT
jgi:NAD(P)-dependent dehydrogenase (short-subunit alcohol dehydrogenase family)